jgi:aryl-alcohol dehydrogenase
VRAQAAVLHERGGALRIEEVDLGAPRPDDVVVRIAGVGICHTDIAAIDGTPDLPLPAVLGHEGAGIVEHTGDAVEGVAVGDHVVLSFDSCGSCSRCAAGRPAYCSDFFALNASGLRRDGADVHGGFCGQSSFATHAIATARNAVPVPRDLPLELLGPLGCSLQTGAGAVLRVLAPEPGASLAVFGAGAVGLASVMAARVAGCSTIIAVDPDIGRLEIALELGATHAVDPEDGSTTRAVRSIVRGGVDYAIEAAGVPEVVTAAVGSLASPGVCATLGFRGSPNPVTIDQGHLIYGRALTGVIEGDVVPGEFIPRLIELYRAGEFPFERLVRTYPFAEIESALAEARRGEVVKPVLLMAGE